MKILNKIICLPIVALAATACENADIEFDNFDYSAVYFAYQYPVRTITLGDDTYDVSADNEHKCNIKAVLAGLYSNGGTVTVDIAVDNSLCNNLKFEDGSPVQAMPESYYTLADNKIVFKGTLKAAVEVQLTDAFFNDVNSLKNTYVVPLKMTAVQNADSILSGDPATPNAPLTDAAQWNELPKNYVLYCIKFINPWHATYLRRGVDTPSNGDRVVRHQKYVEDDELISLTASAYRSVDYTVKLPDGTDCPLRLTFDDNNNCTMSSTSDDFDVSGSGKFVEDGEKNSWGAKDRNALYLNYSVSYASATGQTTVATVDTMVVQTRGVSFETFTPVYE